MIIAGVYNTLAKLLPVNVARTLPLWPVVSNSKPAIGLLSVFVGMKGTAKELGVTAQNIFATKNNDLEKVFYNNLKFVYLSIDHNS